MYIVLCYDVSQKRLAKVHKTVKKYLFPVQKSVFEGDLTEKRLGLLKKELLQKIDPDKDSIAIYCLKDLSGIVKEEIGNNQKDDFRFL